MVPSEVTAVLAEHGPPQGGLPATIEWFRGYAYLATYIDGTVLLITRGDIATLPSDVWATLLRHLDQLGVDSFDDGWPAESAAHPGEHVDYHVRWGTDGPRDICPSAIAHAVANLN